jgi:hypothetical protein
MAKTDQFKAQAFIAAIRGSGGIVSTIAKRVGCEWHTANKYIRAYPTIQQAYRNEKAGIDDRALSNVLKAIMEGDLSISMWWVKMKLGDEFHETTKIEPITLHVIYDDKRE